MEIKTITCHNVYNYGASLQAHALMFYLSELGHDVEVIDYMPDYIRKHISIWDIGPRWKKNLFIRFAYYCYVVPKRIARKESRERFDVFTKKFLKLTTRYNSFDELIKDTPKANVYFCGSDQIWNPTINNGLDPAFYIDFAPKGTIRASYAASFSVSSIEEKNKRFISEELSKLDFISVREKTGVSIVDALKINTKAVNVLDPVFLPSHTHWKSMIYTPKYKDYILVYDQENSKVIKDLAVELSRKTGKKVIAFKELYPRKYADIKISQSGPIDFISLIANADCVVTNSFHCSAFSIIFGREFFVVPRGHQKVNSRMADLLESLQIGNRMINSVESLNNMTPIDYMHVYERLSSLRTQSYKYIDDVLSYAQDKINI